jgi:hypothetical protein
MQIYAPNICIYQKNVVPLQRKGVRNGSTDEKNSRIMAI